MNFVEKIKIRPNNELIGRFKELCNNSRFIYNWLLGYCLKNKCNPMDALNKYRTLVKDGSLYDQKTGVVYNDNFLKSLKNTPSQISDIATGNLKQAFKTSKKSKIPSFKSKYKSKMAFTIHKKTDSTFRLEDGFLKITKIAAFKLDLSKLRFINSETDIKRITISESTYGWYISILIDIPDDQFVIKDNNTSIVGIDWGIKRFATDSDGYYYSFKDHPAYKVYKSLEKKLKHLQSILGKKRDKNKSWKLSKKYRLLKFKIKQVYERMANIRKDFLHETSKSYIEEYGTIVIENLKPSNLLKNHKLARSIAEGMFYTWKVFLTYKSALYGRDLIIVNPMNTSQTCNHCGTILKEKLKLSNRIFKCNHCGLKEDRDVNAAKNILSLA